ncbi:MAG: hypothetical protein Tsb002_02980 [Wenzhouxiangellaceae bacterium]
MCLLILPVSVCAEGSIRIEGAHTLRSSGTNFSITHYTIDAGYQVMSNGSDITLRGIIGQPDTGISQGNDTVFVGGFLEAGAPLFSEFLFQDGFESLAP